MSNAKRRHRRRRRFLRHCAALGPWLANRFPPKDGWGKLAVELMAMDPYLKSILADRIERSAPNAARTP